MTFDDSGCFVSVIVEAEVGPGVVVLKRVVAEIDVEDKLVTGVENGGNVACPV